MTLIGVTGRKEVGRVVLAVFFILQLQLLVVRVRVCTRVQMLRRRR